MFLIVEVLRCVWLIVRIRRKSIPVVVVLHNERGMYFTAMFAGTIHLVTERRHGKFLRDLKITRLVDGLHFKK